ncbi:HLA class II histocompatibility antigen gamma chain isoform X2 [Cyrtonyx montezumae]|uniref:HLA class II histocompatibility antigen gamma chain isoform X2 n=1 Tax=Cyrtonyx montezumae TaxID=9017 RepID=UPI0032DBA4F8
MAEEQRDLISSDGSSAVLPNGNSQRSVLGRRSVLSALSILVALLIAGQAVTIYYVYQQSGQISKLTKTSQSLKLEALQRRMPTSSQPASKMSMSVMNMPMAVKVLPLAPSIGDMPVEAVRPRSNKTEDQVRHLLLKADPRKMFPELKDDMLGNLKRLKKTMSTMDWQDFESWMHKWLLFEMAKGPKGEEQSEIPAEKVQTKCQAEASFSGVQPGRFRPECDENGDYLPKQCSASTGYCWCCYKNGTRIEGTATRGELDCSAPAPTEPEEIFSGVDMLKVK